MRITTVSPSRLKTAKTCDFKYFLTYVWGWSDELFQYTFASEFGTSVHNALEAYARGQLDYKKEYFKQTRRLKTYSEDMNAAPRKAREAFFKDKQCESCPFFNARLGRCRLNNTHVEHFQGCPKKLYQDGIVMIEKAIEKYGEYFRTGIKSKENPNGRVIGVEAIADISWGVDDEGNDIKMNGFIDLVIEYDPETLIVVDYKTGFYIPAHYDFLKDLQPRMYSYAARRMFPNYKFYWVQFDYFRGVALDHAFTTEDDEKTRQEVVALFNRVKNARRIKRRGYDRECKYLCNRPFCDKKWQELKTGIDGSNPDYKKEEIVDDE